MPMVPQFQGGVPQVQDNGSVGAAIVRLPESNFDYAKVMEKALTPVNEFANSFTKTMEVERARMIKAESDDAERQVIGAINDSLMGENGYLKQQGKNASDTYEKSMEGLRTSVDKIIGGMSPQARQAIESRLNDRIVSAVTKANQHRFTQTQSYYVSSSKARIDNLVDDYALHYGDAEYLKKTLASIDSELDYVANLQGMDADQLKAMKVETYGLAQAKMYTAWAQVDPVAAFSAFKLEATDMDPNVAAKIDNQLFAGSRDLFALSLASSVKEGKDGKVEMAWFDDPLAKTGNVFIDSLPDGQRFQITTRAKQMFSTDKAERKQELTLDTEDSLVKVRETGEAEQLTVDQFVAVYGVKEGEAKYAAYSDDFFMNKSLFDMRVMPEADITKLVKEAKPSTDDADYAAKFKRYEILKKAGEQISKIRKDDPVGYSMANGIGGVAPLNFDNKQALIQQLRVRQYGADDMAKDYGVAPVLFSKSEAQAITARLDAMNAQEQSAFLGTLYEAVGVNGVPLIVEQMKSGKVNYAVAMAGMGTVGKDGIALGTKYLLGREAIATKQIAMDSEAEFGTQATIRKAIGTEYDTDPRDTVEGVFPNKQAYEATVELATAVYAFNALAGDRDVDGAVEQSVGEIYVRNNKKVVLPRGMDGDDFEVKVENIAKSFKDPIYVGAFDKKEPKDIPALFAAAKLQTEHVLDGGGMAYSLTYLGQPLLDKKGKKIFIEVK